MLISGIEIGGESLPVVAGVGVDDVQFVDFIEVMFGGVSGEYAGHAGVETAAEQGRNALLLEALLVGPLPGIFEFGHVFGLIIGRIHVIHAGF